MNQTTETKERRERAKEGATVLQKVLDQKEAEKIESTRKIAESKFLIEGETNSKYWFALNKSKVPQNTIYALQNKDGKITKCTREMTKIVSEYHENLQKKPEMTTDRKKAIEKMKRLTKKRLNDDQRNELAKEITEKEIENAIRSRKNGKCPSHLGITYEFWKMWLPKEE